MLLGFPRMVATFEIGSLLEDTTCCYDRVLPFKSILDGLYIDKAVVPES